MKKFINHFFVAIGACATVLTMVSFFFNIEWTSHPVLTWLIIVALLIICLVYACAQVYRKKSIIIRISDNFQLTVKEGNIFNQKGVIVIPVNDYFDTHVGDGIIDPKSVHGQFITNLFKDRIQELDLKIETSLQNQGISGVNTLARKNGKSTKYPLGTCVDVMDGGNKYVCVVTTEFNKDNVAYLRRDHLSNVINGLFNHLETIAGQDIVSMPVIGAGNARLNRSAERIMHYLIDYFDFSLSDKKLLGGVQVVIPSAKEIDLNRILSIFTKRGEK